jgi:hypothetical protein
LSCAVTADTDARWAAILEDYWLFQYLKTALLPARGN